MLVDGDAGRHETAADTLKSLGISPELHPGSGRRLHLGKPHHARMNRMAPDQGRKPIPDSTPERPIFELAAQLYHAIFFHDGPIPVDVVRGSVAAHCRVRKPVSSSAHPLGGQRCLGRPACRALTTKHWSLQRRPPEKIAGAPRLSLCNSATVCSALGYRRPPGGYDADAIRRFADLGALLAAMLHARRSHDERSDDLVISEREIRRQSQILDQIHDSVITMDLQGYITGWNTGAARLFGYSAEEITGRNILLLYADENEGTDAFFNAFLENGSREMKVRRRKKSGEVFWASVSLSVAHDESGVPNGLIGYVVDISGETGCRGKATTACPHFRLCREAVVVTDADERIVSANPAFYEISGFSEHEIIGTTRRQPCNSVPRTAAGRRFGIRSPAREMVGEMRPTRKRMVRPTPHGLHHFGRNPQRCGLPLLFHLLRHIGTQRKRKRRSTGLPTTTR